LALAVSFWARVAAPAELTYQKPPKAVLDVLHAPVSPNAFPNPSGDTLLLATPVLYPPIADLAKPMLRIAGIRIDPSTNGEHHAPYFSALSLKKVTDDSEIKIELPSDARPSSPQWSADGKYIAFTNTTPTAIELWVCEAATGKARRLNGVRINALLGLGFHWTPDQKALLARLVPANRGAAPPAPTAPTGPNAQESAGGLGPSSTYEVRDVLKNPHDAELFDYYGASQLARVDVASGAISSIGKPDIFGMLAPSPDGEYILVERIHRPYSYLHPYERFPKEVEIWSRTGQLVYKLASLPLADQVPVRGVPTGPRAYAWRSTEPATLVWAEALDGGDPRKKAPHRDQIRMLKAPFRSKPADVFKTEQRIVGMPSTENGDLALVFDYDVDRHWRRTFLLNTKAAKPQLQLLWEISSDEHYNNPGLPVFRILPNGNEAIRKDGDWIYLSGSGGSPEGDRPFLDRFNLRTKKKERLFRCDKAHFEAFVAWLNPASGQFITARESPTEPRNYFVRTLTKGAPERIEPGDALQSSLLRPVTQFPNPVPQLRSIKKQLVNYKRPDGVDLSLVLYLPPDYKPGARLPTVMNAYPLDYTEAGVAGQVQGSTQHFTMFRYASPLFFVLAGYAVLDAVAMPVVGPSLTAYDKYLEQIIADATAAIEKAVELGVADPERIGVMGHSHGAMMTANLLAHTRLFRAGIARSGAHNKSLTAFGFQNERRSLWEARDTYIAVSPLFFADKIKDPLLLIHGEADFNPGTIPLQSERLYEAIRGTGGIVRLVMLPLESHGYVARESVEHTLFEMVSWFDRYVKNVAPRGQTLTDVRVR
jgi:dipeptidyl aminopeptidase/acylaminoacyl peptidase